MTDISKLVKSLQKEYGSLKVAGDVVEPSELISTGNKALDIILGGGIAWGYVTENIGLSGSGKTTFMQMLLANAQKDYDVIGIWLDREKAWYNERAEQLGIDINKVIVAYPEDLPSIIDASKFLEDILPKLPKNSYKFIAIDSVSAFDDPLSIDKQDMGKKAQQVHRFFRKIFRFMDNKTSINMSNHITYKPGIMFGDPKTVTSGEATKYYSNYRIEFNDIRDIVDKEKGKEIIGSWIKAKVIKTRRGPNHRDVLIPHLYKTGIPYLGGYVRMLVDRNYIKPKNSKLYDKFEETKLLYNNNKYDEADIENNIEEFPELNFDKYPEYNVNNTEVEEDNDE